jgi:hypothetical protein
LKMEIFFNGSVKMEHSHKIQEDISPRN